MPMTDTKGKHIPEPAGRLIAKRIFNTLPAESQAIEGETLRITPAQMSSIVRQTAAPDLQQACYAIRDASRAPSEEAWTKAIRLAGEAIRQAIGEEEL